MRRGYYAVGVDLMAWRSWRARFLLGDVSCLAIGDRMFDTVLAFEVLEHVPDLNAALAELRRVARRNIILSVPNCQPAPDLAAAGLTYHHWVDRTHRRFFTLESLEATLSASGLKVVQLRVFNPVKPMRLMASALGIPPVMVRPADRLLLAWPAGQRHHMSLLAVAEV
jgi:SAM-dependent methyltransferase